MGRGQISTGGADGLYDVILDYGSPRVTVRIAQMTTLLADLNTRYSNQYSVYTTEKAKEPPLVAALDAAINAYTASANDTTRKAVTDATGALTRQREVTALAKRGADYLALQISQASKERTRLQNIVTTETVPAWCVDLTETATGEVATIEVPGEPQRVLIAPGARAHTAADGQLLARAAMTPEQAFFNAAVLPGWQKHRPNYRVGTITALDTTLDTADVVLDDARSTAQQLPINTTTNLVGIPVVYMTCNASAFEVGDRVVVELSGSWDAPVVIGFVSNPKPCGGRLHVAMTYAIAGTKIIVPNILDGTEEEGYFFSFYCGGTYRYNNQYWALESSQTAFLNSTLKNCTGTGGGSVVFAERVISPRYANKEIVGIYKNRATGAGPSIPDGPGSRKSLIVFNPDTGSEKRRLALPSLGALSDYYYNFCDAFGKNAIFSGTFNPFTASDFRAVVVVDHTTGAVLQTHTYTATNPVLSCCIGSSHYAYLTQDKNINIHEMDGTLVSVFALPSGYSSDCQISIQRRTIICQNSYQESTIENTGKTLLLEISSDGSSVSQIWETIPFSDFLSSGTLFVPLSGS